MLEHAEYDARSFRETIFTLDGAKANESSPTSKMALSLHLRDRENNCGGVIKKRWQ
jgi:hypothetical protein